MIWKTLQVLNHVIYTYMRKFTLTFGQSFLLQTLIYYGRMNEWPMNTIHMHIASFNIFFGSPWFKTITMEAKWFNKGKNAKAQIVTWRKREWVGKKRMLRVGIYGGMINLANLFIVNYAMLFPLFKLFTNVVDCVVVIVKGQNIYYKEIQYEKFNRVNLI